jgi:4-hydroxy-tetrahydrodipicolinate synthase
VPNRSFRGIVPALVTPFREDERIDYNAWQILIDTLISAGVDGLFVGGSSGEFHALDLEERTVALRFAIQAAAGRLTVYGNVGTITTRDTIRLAHAAEAEGVDALVVVTPYYIRPTQDELAQHYIDICRAVRTPVMAYNFPPHGGVELAPETLARVAAKCPNMAGLKDSSGKLEQAAAYLACAPERDLAVLVGYDNLVLAGLELGCAGAVAASATITPRLFVDLYKAFREGRREEAVRLQALATELGDALALHTFPSVVKAAVEMSGLTVGQCRKPVGPLPAEAREKLAGVLSRVREAGYLAGTADTIKA